ncbi:major facilitator superfamily domain-containing protein [Infundibulicybe gibba]|nr:major facilitator superfamily domain-containing protein [Infundibulicybe gibba]
MRMSSEESPLLASGPGVSHGYSTTVKHDQVYERFSASRKRAILAMVAWCGLIPPFVSWSLIPTIPQISKDLNSTPSVVSLAVSLSIFATSLGGLCGASYSTFYGRRAVYLSGLPLLCLGSMGVAWSRSVPELMVWRFLQSFGASPGFAVGAGTIGDIYKLEERGRSMGVFFAVCLLAPTLAPPAGGIAAHYASWRDMQLALAIAGALAFVIILLFFPETSHPGKRGIDQVQPVSTPTLWKSWKPFLVNPLRPLSLLRSPNLLAITLVGFATLLTSYALLIPLAFTFGARYHITNDALIGACFLPAGFGNMIGAPLAGRISDKIVVKWRQRRGGVWYPEDRLRVTLVGAAFLVPFSILFSGLLSQFIGGKTSLILNLICLFINGVGVDMVLSASAAYTVDVMHSRSAEAMAANSGLRSILMSLSMAIILPLIDTIGVAATNALGAMLEWLALGVLLCIIRYGAQMRAWVDVGYSTAENN